MNELPDIVKELLEKKAYHSEQLRKINRALQALNDDNNSETSDSLTRDKHSRGKIQWKSEVIDVFDEYPTHKLAPQNIRELLNKKGIPTDTMAQKSAVYTTIKRLVDDGIVEKINDGQYRKKLQDVREIRFPEKN